MLSPPDVLVLGAGGVLGEAWMTGVLAGIEDATGFDLHQCEYFVGTSAGSIVAAQLLAGKPLRRPRTRASHPQAAALDHRPDASLAVAARRAVSRAGRVAWGASAPLAQVTLTLTRSGGAVARAALLRRLPPASGSLADLHASIERTGAGFDGRLRVVAVDRRNGRRVVFGSPGAPVASVADAVTASCTVPWLFEPVTIGGREYVDGGVWSPSNLDVAPGGRGTHVLCLNPTSSIVGGNSLIGVARSVARSAVALESLVLRRRGAIVATTGPDAAAAVAMGADFMDPEPRQRVLAAGYQQGFRVATEQ